MRPSENPKIPEGINASSEHPLKEFALLLVAIGGFVIVLVVTLSIMAEMFAGYVPFSWEKKLTASFEGQDQQELSIEELPEEQALLHGVEFAIKELGEALVPHADLPEEMQLTFHLMDEGVPNAFATLGGHIFVTTGLLSALESENGLAMVMAHEIAHIKDRHPVKALSRGALIQLVLSVTVGSQDSAALQAVLGNTGLLTLMSFNRDMERDADSAALLTLERKYGHVVGADEFFVKMSQQIMSPEWQSFFQTHPHTDSRIENIESKMSSGSISKPLIPLDPRIQKYLDASSEKTDENSS